MATESTPLTRIFRYEGRDLPDPNSKWAPEKVRSFYSNEHGELTTASIKGPTLEGDKSVYVFQAVVGTKG